MRKHRLDFGCGDSRHPDCTIGVDRRKCSGATIVWDAPPPLPMESGSCEFIHTAQTLEHLSREELYQWMREFHRLLSVGGVLHIRVPHFSSTAAWSSLDHVRSFGIYSFSAYDDAGHKHFPFFGGWTIKSTKLYYSGSGLILGKRRVVGRLYYLAGRILDYLANLDPFLCERVWCYWVGGFSDVEVILVKR